MICTGRGRYQSPLAIVNVFATICAVCLALLVPTGCAEYHRAEQSGSTSGKSSVKELIREATHGVFAGSGIVSDAYWVVTDQCMARKGFPSSSSYRNIGPITTVVGDYGAAEAAQLDTWFGVSTAEWGAKYGYHEVPQSALFTVERKEEISGPDGYREVLYGSGEDRNGGGCFGYAGEVINEGTPPSEDLAAIQLEVERQVRSRVHADAGIAAASADWSACMASRGYHYADPMEAFDAFAPFADGGEVHAYSSPRASEDEKRVAEADGACKEKTGFWDKVQEATDAAEVVVAEQMRSDLETIRLAHERMVENANAILDSH